MAASVCACVFAGLLGGCRVGPEYARPATPVPEAYRAPAAAEASSAVPVEWWKGFGSPDLDALIAGADADSFDIGAAIARVAQADAQLRVSGAALLPEVDASGKQTWNRTSVTSTNLVNTPSGPGFTVGRETVQQRTWAIGPNLSYELDFWGALRSTQEAAAASALFSRYDRETVRLTVLSSVANGWFAALAYQDRLAVAERNLHDAETILGAIEARSAAGTANLLDVSQQQALVAGIRATMPGLRNQRDQQVAALGVLVGRLPELIPLPTGTLTTLSLPEVAPGLPSTLLARRPDVASAEVNLIAQNANIRVARAAFFPTITLTGQAGWQSSVLHDLLTPQSLLFSTVANAAQVVFDNGRIGAQYEQAKRRQDELVATYRKAVVQAFTDVENGLIAWRETTEQERLERQAVDTAQRAADIARAQVLAGTLDIVTALQTQTTLFTDLDLLAQARLARFQALVSLYKALGGGWSQQDVVAPESPIFNGVL